MIRRIPWNIQSRSEASSTLDRSSSPVSPRTDIYSIKPVTLSMQILVRAVNAVDAQSGSAGYGDVK